MSLGGGIGGAVVTFGAPVAFTGLYEYPLLLLVFVVVFGVLRGRETLAWFRDASLIYGGSRLAGVSMLVALAGVGVVAQLSNGDQFQHRSFYGTYRVTDVELPSGVIRRVLVHGHTNHGAELDSGPLKGRPLDYYHESQCIAEVHRLVSDRRRRAVIGLGAGVLSVWNHPEGTLHYYEIDPDNEAIARQWFSYLGDAPGEVEVIVGDGRLQMERSDEHYGFIMVDAFSGDGIPVHLVTVEALQTYLDHLDAGGILLLHVSNRYYELRPFLRAEAADLGLAGAWQTPGVVPEYAVGARCVVLARTEAPIAPLVDSGWHAFAPDDGFPEVPVWTDDHVSLLRALFVDVPGPPAGP